jgi:hypothetical protein
MYDTQTRTSVGAFMRLSDRLSQHRRRHNERREHAAMLRDRRVAAEHEVAIRRAVASGHAGCRYCR